MNYEMLFTPYKIGNVEIKNRVCMAPMLMDFGQFDGKATEKMMNYYEERAKGGVGLIFTEITRINDIHGASSFGQLAMSHDYQIDSLSELVSRVHSHGTKIMVELHHPGRQNLGLLIGTVPICITFDKIMPNNSYSKLLYGAVVPFGKKLMEKSIVPRVVAPSKCERSKFSNSVNRELSKPAIHKLVNEFIEGALRVKKSGADGVEIHASHGYLIQQFLSPHTNKRTDEYGGSLQNRMRFLLQIVTGIKQKCGKDFPLVVRLTADEMYDRIGKNNCGYGLNEGISMAKILEKAGVDALDISSGAYDTFNYWLEPTTFDCGWRKNLAEEVKKVVSIPVIAANLIRSPQQAEKQLQDGIQDFVSLGRPMIADPHWCEKVKNGNENEIKRCVCCLYCFESMMNGAYTGDHGHCSVNPFVGRENIDLNKSGNGKTVVVIGAGVAGLTAGEILARRNYKVVILEKEKEIGGQIQLANKPPKKEKLTWCIDDIYSNAVGLGVEVKLNTLATKELIDSYNPYAVICATGGNAVFPNAFKGDNVATVSQILDGSIKLKDKKVVVIGSGMTGLETSELLCSQGNKVTIIEMADEIAPGAWFQQKDDAMPKLIESGTEFLTSHKLISIDRNSVTLEKTKDKKEVKISCDFVVLSMGVKSENALFDSIKNTYDNVYNIGDSVKIGRIANATESAYQVAVNL